jgi:predicted CopG family antitoxin
MAIKTIALDASVYDRLAATKRGGESFSKAIDRLLTDAAHANTGSDILRRLEGFSALPDEDAAVYMAVIDENRADEQWGRR